MSYEQLAQAVTELSASNTALKEQAAAVLDAADVALAAAAARTKVNVAYPFTYVAGQAQYDVEVISGDNSVTTAGLSLWVEGAIEYAFTVDTMKKFTLLNPEVYSDGQQMRIIVNARYDHMFDQLDNLYTVEKTKRSQDYLTYLEAMGLETEIPYAAGIDVVRTTQVVRYLDVNYRPLRAALPFTTSTWVEDQSKLVQAEDITLRQFLYGPQGSEVLGFTRSSLATATGTVNRMLSAQPYNIYEFSDAVVDRPDLNDPDTWDWTPAIAKAFTDIPLGGELVFTPGVYRSSGATRIGALRMYAGGNVTFLQIANAPTVTLKGRLDDIISVTTTEASSYDFSGEGAATACTKLSFAATPTWVVGDIIKIVADDVLFGSANTEQRTGEFGFVGAVVDNDVWITHLLRDPYTLNVRARRQVDDMIGLYGFTFDTLDTGNANGWNSDLLQVVNGQNCEFENLTAEFGYGIFMNLQSIFRYKAKGIMVRRLINDPVSQRYGYGISDKSCAFGVVTMSHFMGCRHGYTTGTSRVPIAGSEDTHRYGRTYATKVSDSTGMGCTNAPFDAHELADSIEFHNCTAHSGVRGPQSSGAGFQMRGRNGVFHGCIASQMRVGFSFISTYANETSNVTLINCEARGVTSQAVINSGAAGRTIDKVTIKGGKFSSITQSNLLWIDHLILDNPTFIVPAESGDYSKCLAFGRGRVTGTVTFDLSNVDPTLTNVRCWSITSAFTNIDIADMRIIGAPASVTSQAICEGQLIDPAYKVTFRKVEVDRHTEGTKSGQTTIAYRYINSQEGTTSNFITRVLTASGQFVSTGTLYGDITLKLSGGPYTLATPDAGKHAGQRMIIINAGTAILTMPAGGTTNLTASRAIAAGSALVLVWDGTIWLVAS
jgi:hypothetical protein